MSLWFFFPYAIKTTCITQLEPEFFLAPCHLPFNFLPSKSRWCRGILHQWTISMRKDRGCHSSFLHVPFPLLAQIALFLSLGSANRPFLPNIFLTTFFVSLSLSLPRLVWPERTMILSYLYITYLRHSLLSQPPLYRAMAHKRKEIF